MSIHPSLRISLKNQKQKSILKRVDRIKQLLDKGAFKEECPAFGLPKIKVVKLKVKKEKTEKKAAEEPSAAKPSAAKSK